MTFAVGRRFLIVEGAERYKDAEVERFLVPALAGMAPETTVAFFAREDGRAKVPAKLVAAVKAAGGDIAREDMLKAKDLPRWAIAEAGKLGVQLDGAAARALVGAVGERQQRLLRELEKLALEHGQGAAIGVEEVEAVAAPSAERQVWGLVDALVGRDRTGATRAFLELRGQGESLPRLVPLMARRVREVLGIALRLEAGESPQQVKSSLKMSPYAADLRIKDARASDVETLRRALEALAELELDSRGQSELADDTAALRAIDVIAA
jgi:DNA polymerase-3 subunit delta